MQALTGKVVDVSLFRVFGSSVLVHVDESLRKALDSKTREGIVIGVNFTSQSVRVMFVDKLRVSFVSTVHCKFNEKVFPFPLLVQQRADAVAAAIPAPDLPAPAEVAATAAVHVSTAEPDDGVPVFASAATVSASVLPKTYAEAMRGPDRLLWEAAIAAELAVHQANETWECVSVMDIPAGHKPLNSLWVFTIKPAEDGGQPRFKARLVARGDQQHVDLDVSSVYAPVVNHDTLRIMLAVAAIKDYEVDHLDAVAAFLNSPLDEELYMRFPQGLPVKPGYALRLRKSLYGLRTAPKIWNKTLHNFIVGYGLVQSEADPCLYFNSTTWVAVWVDDLLVMAVDAASSSRFKSAVGGAFKMRDLGPVTRFVGLEITRDRVNRTLTITATRYIDEFLELFGLTDARDTHTPFPPNMVLEATPPGVPLLDRAHYPYRVLVGKLMYLAFVLRGDAAFAVSQLARYQDGPSMVHWKAAQYVARYFKYTKMKGITYSANPHHARECGVLPAVCRTDRLYVWMDASYGEDTATRRSRTGYVLMFGGAMIAFGTELQGPVAQSTGEAEYMAIAAAVKKVLAISNVLPDLTGTPMATVPMLEDNQSAIKMAMRQGSTSKTKHIAVRHHLVKQCVADGTVSIHYVPTEFQAADCLTKSLDKIKVSLFSRIILGN